MSGAQAAFAIASILQVVLIALASTMCVHHFDQTNERKLTWPLFTKHLRLVEGKRPVDPFQWICYRRPSGRQCGCARVVIDRGKVHHAMPR